MVELAIPGSSGGHQREMPWGDVEPGAPLTDDERASLARIGECAPCTQRWLEYFLPTRRYYLVQGVSGGHCGYAVGRQMTALRLMDHAWLRQWSGLRLMEPGFLDRDEEMVDSADWITPPLMLEATLAALELIEEVVARPHAARSLVVFRAYWADGKVALASHGVDEIASSTLPNSIPLDTREWPWRLKPAQTSDTTPEPYAVTASDEALRYVPSGCVPY